MYSKFDLGGHLSTPLTLANLMFSTQKLKCAGICTVKGVQMMTKKRLCAIKGLSEAKVDKIREAVLKVGSGG